MVHRCILLPSLIGAFALVVGLPIGPALAVRIPAQPIGEERPQADALPENGDFEDPVVTRVTTRYAGEVFGGWTVESGSIDQVHESYWMPPSGHQSLDLTGYCDAGAIYREIPTTPGQSYLLRFALAGNPVGGARVVQAEIWWGADLVGTVSFDTSGHSTTNMGWIYRDYTVVALGSSTRLKFKSLTSGCYGPAIDAVTLSSSPPTPFLDLPVSYADFLAASQGSNGGGGPGYVNSWFDHTQPGFYKGDGNLTPWYGPYTGGGSIGQGNCNTPAGGLGSRCYDGHDGIDFRRVSDGVLAADDGRVYGIGYQANGFGNYLYIDHHNCYASFYAHLSSTSVPDGRDVITGEQVGVMGSTGLKAEGIHLHFGVYYDPDCDGDWSDKIVVDPYGWSGSGSDPYEPPPASNSLWKYPVVYQSVIGSGGGQVSTPGGTYQTTLPPNAVSDPVTLELLPVPPVGAASAELRSTGYSFWMRVLEWLTGGSSPSLMGAASADSFTFPVTVTVHYDPSWMPHLDVNQLTICQWDDVGAAWVALPTTLDTASQLATAQTGQPGHFDLQGPLVCPADTLEPSDNYDEASVVQTDGSLVDNLFDIAQDEDWFRFVAAAGVEYHIQTTNLADGVGTALGVFDTDGAILLASDDDGGVGDASSLIWQAPTDGIYFVQVKQVTGSVFGCDLAYDISVLAPTISGNAGVAGATLSYTDGAPKTAVADGSGAYSFQVSYNWSGTVTPSKPSHIFLPANRTYTNVQTDQAGQDFTAEAANRIYLTLVTR